MTLTPNTQITQENVGLLPCPFCGGAGEITFGMSEHWGRCTDCGAESKMSSSPPLALAAWNRRPALSPPAEVPFAAEDACLACNSPTPVDWTVVGPKLVEAARDGLASRNVTYIHTRLRYALAAAQPEGK